MKAPKEIRDNAQRDFEKGFLSQDQKLAYWCLAAFFERMDVQTKKLDRIAKALESIDKNGLTTFVAE